MRTLWTGCAAAISEKICNYECGIWLTLFEFPHVKFEDSRFILSSLLLSKKYVL